MITCVKLTPHQDTHTGALYVQASTIIPVPGVEDYLVGVGHGQQPELRESRSSIGAKLTATFARNKNDEVSQFVKRVGALTRNGLPDEIRPDRIGRWAGDAGDRRYYNLWYSRPPWGNWKVNYSLGLRPEKESEKWLVIISFENRQRLPLPALESSSLNVEQAIDSHGIFSFVRAGPDNLNNSFANKIADTLRELISQITPVVNDLENEGGEDDEA